jgi:hypothetical protein
MYEKRLQAQKRNKAYKRRGRAHRNGSDDHRAGDINNGDVGGYSDDENESVDSLKKWRKHQSEFDSLFIPSQRHSEVYARNGHVFYFTATRSMHRSEFNLSQFISAITSRRSPHRVHRSKLLKVEVLSTAPPQPEHEEMVPIRLRLTVSSPSVFGAFLKERFAANSNSSDLPSFWVDAVAWTVETPPPFQSDAKCTALMLCIKPLSAAQHLAVWSSQSGGHRQSHHSLWYLVESEVLRSRKWFNTQHQRSAFGVALEWRRSLHGPCHGVHPE